MPKLEVTIAKTRETGQYLVKFRGYAPTDRNLTLYRDMHFPTLKAAREYANRLYLDALGIF